MCYSCKTIKPFTDFAESQNKKNGKNNMCKECNRKYQKEHYKKNKKTYIDKAKLRRNISKDIFLEYMKDKKCAICWYNKSIAALDFHHKKDKFKLVSVMVRIWYSWGRIIKEIEKCDILCSNCHREITSKEHWWYTA